jgi:tripartite-type tricarboxylate transporter receptor subunit TctC
MARKTIKAVAIAAAFLISTAAAQAQEYPTRAIRMIHGFPAGGNVDVVARVVAQEMTKGLGQPVVVEEKLGGVGLVAADVVSKATADGYTLMAVAGAHPVVAAVHKSLPYDPIDSFDWISTAMFYPFLITVRRESNIHSVKDLLDAARAKPGAVSYGAPGIGAIQHLTAELLGTLAQVKFLSVAYRGEAPALTAALGGEVDFLVSTTTLAVPHVQSGALRPLAITSQSRWQALPDVPTVQEAGVAGFDVSSWSGFAAPRGVPRPVIDRLNAEIRRVLQVPEVRARMAGFGGDVRASTPEEMRTLVTRQVALWAGVVKEAKLETQ